MLMSHDTYKGPSAKRLPQLLGILKAETRYFSQSGTFHYSSMHKEDSCLSLKLPWYGHVRYISLKELWARLAMLTSPELLALLALPLPGAICNKQSGNV